MKAHLANRWLGIAAIAALAALAATLIGVGQIPPAHAQASNIKAHCESRAIYPYEGNNYQVTITAEDKNARIAGRWYTVEKLSTSSVTRMATPSSDFEEVTGLYQEGTGSITGKFSTTEDGYAELLETFTIYFDNSLKAGADVECEVVIFDDDVGVTDVNITSSPVDGHTYRLGESIEIALTFNRHADVSGEVLLDLRVGDESDTSGRVASYHRHTGAIVFFRYDVRPGDSDGNGISLDGGYVDENGDAHGIGGSGSITPSGYARYESFSARWHGIGDQAGHAGDAPGGL